MAKVRKLAVTKKRGAVIVCRPGHPFLSRHPSQRDGFDKPREGTSFLEVDRYTTDRECARLAQRFGISFGRLLSFRLQEDLWHYIA